MRSAVSGVSQTQYLICQPIFAAANSLASGVAAAPYLIPFSRGVF